MPDYSKMSDDELAELLKRRRQEQSTNPPVTQKATGMIRSAVTPKPQEIGPPPPTDFSKPPPVKRGDPKDPKTWDEATLKRVVSRFRADKAERDYNPVGGTVGTFFKGQTAAFGESVSSFIQALSELAAGSTVRGRPLDRNIETLNKRWDELAENERNKVKEFAKRNPNVAQGLELVGAASGVLGRVAGAVGKGVKAGVGKIFTEEAKKKFKEPFKPKELVGPLKRKRLKQFLQNRKKNIPGTLGAIGAATTGAGIYGVGAGDGENLKEKMKDFLEAAPAGPLGYGVGQGIRGIGHAAKPFSKAMVQGAYKMLSKIDNKYIERYMKRAGHINALENDNTIGRAILDAQDTLRDKMIDGSDEATKLIPSTVFFTKGMVSKNIAKIGKKFKVDNPDDAGQRAGNELLRFAENIKNNHRGDWVSGQQFKHYMKRMSSVIRANKKAGAFQSPDYHAALAAYRKMRDMILTQKGTEDYANAMVEVAKDTKAFNEFVKRGKNNYWMGDSEKQVLDRLIKVGNETADSNQVKALRAMDSRLGTQLEEMAKDLATRQQFQTTKIRGSRDVNLWPTLMFGMFGTKEALIPGTLMGMAFDTYGGQIAKGIIDMSAKQPSNNILARYARFLSENANNPVIQGQMAAQLLREDPNFQAMVEELALSEIADVGFKKLTEEDKDSLQEQLGSLDIPDPTGSTIGGRVQLGMDAMIGADKIGMDPGEKLYPSQPTEADEKMMASVPMMGGMTRKIKLDPRLRHKLLSDREKKLSDEVEALGDKSNLDQEHLEILGQMPKATSEQLLDFRKNLTGNKEAYKPAEYNHLMKAIDLWLKRKSIKRTEMDQIPDDIKRQRELQFKIHRESLKNDKRPPRGSKEDKIGMDPGEKPYPSQPTEADEKMMASQRHQFRSRRKLAEHERRLTKEEISKEDKIRKALGKKKKPVQFNKERYKGNDVEGMINHILKPNFKKRKPSDTLEEFYAETPSSFDHAQEGHIFKTTSRRSFNQIYRSPTNDVFVEVKKPASDSDFRMALSNAGDDAATNMRDLEELYKRSVERGGNRRIYLIINPNKAGLK